MLRLFAAAALPVLGLGRLTELHEMKPDVGGYSFCSDPVTKAKVVFPDSIAGRTTKNYEMYSGYINVRCLFVFFLLLLMPAC